MVAEASSIVGVIVFVVAHVVFALLYAISSTVAHRRPVWGAMIKSTLVMLYIYVVERFGVGISTRTDGVDIFPWRWIAFILSMGSLMFTVGKHQRLFLYTGVAAIGLSVLFNLFLFSATLSGDDFFRWVTFVFVVYSAVLTFFAVSMRTRFDFQSLVVYVTFVVFMVAYHIVWILTAGADFISFTAGEWLYLILDALFFVAYPLYIGFTVGKDETQATTFQAAPNAAQYL